MQVNKKQTETNITRKDSPEFPKAPDFKRTMSDQCTFLHLNGLL